MESLPYADSQPYIAAGLEKVYQHSALHALC